MALICQDNRQLIGSSNFSMIFFAKKMIHLLSLQKPIIRIITIIFPLVGACELFMEMTL